jgi:protein-L-isoaspartate(D-aspartate) O-methyltransferase
MDGRSLAQLAVWLVAVAALGALACEPRPNNRESAKPRTAPAAAATDERAEVNEPPEFAAARRTMVREQLSARGISDARVLAAMAKVPRHEFVEDSDRDEAYDDHPLPIAADQTISQPYIVALMSELADVRPGDKVLEVGTGSGYQAAVLAAMGAEVYSIEIVPELATSARARLQRLGYAAEVRVGDGYAGWVEQAPFDAIVITAAPPSMPEPLPKQLAKGGKLVVPVGEGTQDLWVWTRTEAGFDKRNVLGVRFVPMTGKAQGTR